MRLIRFLATINRPDASWFVTLTYRDWLDDAKLWKAQLNRWLTAVRWRFPKAAGVWRLEFQERGAPHFHVLLWLGETVDEVPFRDWCTERWLDAIGNHTQAVRMHAVTVAPIRDLLNSKFYLSLYQAKDKNDRKDIPTGRLWGKIQEGLLCTEPIKTAYLDGQQSKLLRRLLRRSFQSRNRLTYRRSNYWKALGRGELLFSACMPFMSAKAVVDWVLKQHFDTPLKRRAMPVGALIVTPANQRY